MGFNKSEIATLLWVVQQEIKRLDHYPDERKQRDIDELKIIYDKIEAISKRLSP